MFNYSNTGTDVTYKILVSWDDDESNGLAYRTSDTITKIQETPSSFVITDACHDVFMCDKTKYNMTSAVQNVFNSTVESGPHQWMREVPFADIRASE
jgi:hypothetical protein